jgi:nuclear GTP-binding protein
MKYKIRKKVTEHHRKLRKSAKESEHRKKKTGLLECCGYKRANEVDPGIPNSFPYKEEMLNDIAQLAQQAEARATQYEQQKVKQQETHDDDEPELLTDKSKKSFYRHFKKVVEAADVVLQILDARDPLGTRSKQIEEMILTANKRVILVLNKIDLVPK